MAKQKRLIVKSLGLAIFLLTLLLGCNNGTPKTPSLSIDPATATVTVGGSTKSFSAELKNSSDTISWTLTGAGSITPASGATTVYTPPATGGASTATLSATAGTLSDTATITINAASGNPDFSLSLDDNAVTIGQEGSSAIEVTVNPTGGFSGAVNFSVSGQPTGVSAAFSNSSSTTGSTLTVSVAETVPVGSSTLTITGTSGSLTKTATLNLTVAAGLPVITTVSLPTIFLGTGSTSTQLPQGLSTFSGPIQVLLNGKRLAGMTSTTLGTLTGTVESSEATTAIVRFTIPAGFAVGQKELTVVATAGTGTKANAIEITPWTVGTPIGGVEVGTPDHPFAALTQTQDRATSGDTITIANGTYNKASGETFPITIAAGVTVVGESKTETKLIGETTDDCLVLAGSAKISKLNISTCVRSFVATTGNITLEDINGSNSRGLSTSISAKGTAEVTIRNSAFTNNNIGIEVEENARATILASSFNGNFAGVFASGGAIVSAINSNFDNNTGSGFFVEGNASVTLDGGTVSNNGKTSNTDENIGFFIKDSAEALVLRTIFDSNGLGDGTAGSESDTIRIIGNGTLTLTDVTVTKSGLDGVGACCGTVPNKPVVDITGSTITDSGEDGLNFFDGTVATVTNTIITGSGSDGIESNGNATEGPELTLTTVTASNNKEQGLNIFGGTEKLTASDLTVEQNTFTGLNVGAMGDLAVSSSVIDQNGVNGITLNFPEDVELIGVTVTNNTGDGVAVSQPTSLTMRGSSLSNNGGSGILFSNIATDVDIDLGTAAQAGGNTFAGNGDFGLDDLRDTSTKTISAIGNTFGGSDPQPTGLKIGASSEGNRWRIATTGNEIQY